MANKPTATDIERVAQEFLKRLPYPRQKGPKRQYGIFVGGFPGSGKTTAAREFAGEAGNCFHVQANDARVLLTEIGDFEWNINVHEVLKNVLTELGTGGHSFILDGAFMEDSDKSLRKDLIRKFGFKALFVAVNCPLEVAKKRAERRYADGKKSEFGDWRAGNLWKYVGQMPERKEALEVLLWQYQDLKIINNNGPNDFLNWKVRKIWSEFRG